MNDIILNEEQPVSEQGCGNEEAQRTGAEMVKDVSCFICGPLGGSRTQFNPEIIFYQPREAGQDSGNSI